MSFDIVDFLAIVSVVIGVVLVYKMAADIITVRKQRNNMADQRQRVSLGAEYKKILDATHWLENERQRNTGKHYEDKSVYLNRAQTIRTSTAFFSLVNE